MPSERAWFLAAALCWAAPLLADVAAIRELIRSGRFQEAAAACDRELKTAPASAPLWTLKGFALRGTGDNASSLAAFRMALKSAPGYAPALQAAAQIEFDARDPRARATLESILRADAANATAHAMLGELDFEARDWERARVHLSKGPEAPANQWRLGVCAFELGRWREAAARFEALLRLREHAPTRFNVALSLFRANDAAAALTALAPLNDPDSISLRAACHRALKDIPEALDTLQAGVREHPRDERLLLDLAILCLDQNSVELGTRVIEAGLERNPGSARLLTTLGVFQVRGGDPAKARETFARASRLAPESGMGEVGTASILMQLGLAREAAAVLRNSGSNEPMAALTLARALLQDAPSASEKAEAKRILTGLVSRDPSNAAARSLLGKTLATEEQSAAALPHLEAALRSDPSDRTAAYQLMLVYRKLGRAADANRMHGVVRELMVQEKAAESEAGRYRLANADFQGEK